MLTHNDLKKGVQFLLDNQPYEVLESSSMFKGRGSSVMQTKLKNLITGNTLSRTFHTGDNFKEIEIEKVQVKFLYTHKDKYFFCKKDNPGDRFELLKEVIGDAVKFLKSNEIVEGVKFNDKIINVNLPIKVHLKVKSAPPGVKGDRAQGGNKSIILETGATINVPLFIEESDTLEINTESGEYVRRVE